MTVANHCPTLRQHQLYVAFIPASSSGVCRHSDNSENPSSAQKRLWSLSPLVKAQMLLSIQSLPLTRVRMDSIVTWIRAGGPMTSPPSSMLATSLRGLNSRVRLVVASGW